MPRLARNGASGWFSTNFTVMSSTFSIALMSSGKPMPLKYSQAAPATYWFQGLSAFSCRSKEKITSSAFMSRVGVKKSVVWNFTPGRSLKVYSRPSSEISQLSARPGSMVGRAGLEFDKAVVDGARRGVESGAGRVEAGIEAFRAAFRAIDQRLRRRAEPGKRRQADAEQRRLHDVV